MYERREWGRRQRIGLAVAGGLFLILSWWLLIAGGARASVPRCWLVFAALAIYYMRSLLTLFIFLKRGMSWEEAATISIWLLIVFVTLSIAARSSTGALSGLDWI